MKTKITVRYPPDEVRQLLRFAAKQSEVDHTNVMVKVKNSSREFRGMAYHTPPDSLDWGRIRKPTQARRLVTIGIGGPECFPRTEQYRGRQITLRDWRDALVWIAAHEFEHIRQYDADTTPNERDPNWLGWYVLTKYQQITGGGIGVGGVPCEENALRGSLTY